MQFKNLATICLLLIFVQASVAISAEGVIEIIAGIINGVIEKNDLQEIEACITNVDDMTINIERAIEGFEEGDAVGILEGLMEIEQFVLKIPPTLKGCVAIQDDINTFLAWGAIILDPLFFIETVSKNLVLHIFQVKKEVQVIINDYNTEQYF